eukprot:TRINITY_DN1835_c0_g1_i3.p1 TRINITY_DN1835_c0_g1~~TRINITY_DN1835_c0_g1_i3.p1  ORF type:complete len:542 (+),score=92.86 TRINITY_DN1835_c0_g1_i3:35-1627(+)
MGDSESLFHTRHELLRLTADNKLETNANTLNLLRRLQQPVRVVAVFGKAGTGKSALLNQLVASAFTADATELSNAAMHENTPASRRVPQLRTSSLALLGQDLVANIMSATSSVPGRISPSPQRQISWATDNDRSASGVSAGDVQESDHPSSPLSTVSSSSTLSSRRAPFEVVGPETAGTMQTHGTEGVWIFCERIKNNTEILMLIDTPGTEHLHDDAAVLAMHAVVFMLSCVIIVNIREERHLKTAGSYLSTIESLARISFDSSDIKQPRPTLHFLYRDYRYTTPPTPDQIRASYKLEGFQLQCSRLRPPTPEELHLLEAGNPLPESEAAHSGFAKDLLAFRDEVFSTLTPKTWSAGPLEGERLLACLFPPLLMKFVRQVNENSSIEIPEMRVELQNAFLARLQMQIYDRVSVKFDSGLMRWLTTPGTFDRMVADTLREFDAQCESRGIEEAVRKDRRDTLFLKLNTFRPDYTEVGLRFLSVLLVLFGAKIVADTVNAIMPAPRYPQAAYFQKPTSEPGSDSSGGYFSKK